MQFQLKHLWHIQDGGEEISFGAGFWFDGPKDLTQVAKDLEEGISICASKFIAGPRHLKNVLYQASEYWRRGKRLARNPSIDLLMRVLCESQISKAVELSQVSFAREIAVFGVSKQMLTLEGVFDALVKVGG
ncbi:MAG TPA: KEOPS complex subunit Cgi121, partial [Nitrososphaerales archaeon]|nr:KEOPS complex subunit Cgi121 [Nitrososphaerales archaeon]